MPTPLQPQNIAVKFVVDDSALQHAVDLLVKMGQVDKATADQIKASNAAFNERTKNVQQLDTAAEELNTTFKDLSKQADQFQKNIAAAGATEGMTKITQAAEKLDTRATSLVGRLRALKQEISLMESSGQAGTKAFEKLVIQAARLEDQIGDTALRVRALASDTFALDATIGVVQGLASAYSIAQGAAGLLGGSNEQLQKSLVKIQASIAILNGLQQIQNSLQKQSPAYIGVTTAAQNLYSFAVGGSTGALKLFRIALASTGVGLIIIALAALVANLDKVKDKVLELLPGLNKLGDVWDTIKQKFNGFMTAAFEGLKTLGAFLTHSLKGEFAQAIGVFEGLGKRVGEAFNRGVNEAVEKQAHEAAMKLLEQQTKDLTRLISLEAARGKEIYSLKKKQLEGELALLADQKGKESEEYKDKYTEIQVLTIEHNKAMSEIEKKRKAERQEALNQEIIAEVDFWNRLNKFRDLQNIAPVIEKVKTGTELLDSLLEESRSTQIAGEQDLTDEVLSEMQERMAARQEEQRLAIELARQSANLIMDFYAFSASMREQDFEDLEKQKERGLITEQEYQKQLAILKRKEAIAQRDARVFEILIRTAESAYQIRAQAAVLSSNPVTAPLAALAWAQLALLLVSSAAQVSAVFATPLPSVPGFAKGTKKAPAGFKIVGEEGPELLHDNGGYAILPNKESMALMEAWDKPGIYLPSYEAYDHVGRGSDKGLQLDYDLLAKKVGKEIAKHPKVQMNVDEKGFVKHVVEGAHRQTELDNHYSWNG